MKILKALKAIVAGKKTYGVGLAGLAVGALVSFGIIDLDITVGEQVQLWLGSFATITIRAAINKLLGG